MRTLIERFVGSLWTMVAALIILAATLVSIIRLMLPQIDQQRDAIEIWLSDVVGRPIEIGQVSASWHGWTPTIDVADLVLLTSDRKTELIRFDYAAVDISPVNSLAERKLVPHRLIVGGMRVALERDLKGTISVAGMRPSRWPVARWLLEQQNFTLRDAHITFKDAARALSPLQFSDVTLSITHDAGQQKIAGTLRRDGREVERYVFALRTTGDILGSSWAGDLFVDIQHGEAGSTLALAGWTDNRIVGGEVDAKIWSRWENAKLQRAAVEIESSTIRVSGSKTDLIDRIDAAGIALRVADGWSFEFDRLQIDSVGDQGTQKNVAVRWRNRRGEPPFVAFRASNLHIPELVPLLKSSIVADENLLSELSALNPRGAVNGILGAVAWEGDRTSRYFFSTSVNNLSVGESSNAPAISGLDFTLHANQKGGFMRTDETDGVILQSERWLVQPLELQKVSGGVRWKRGRDSLSVTTDLLEVRAETIDFSTSGSLTWNNRKGPDLNLITRINSGDLARLHLLVPAGKLPPRGEKWLRGAFRSGQLKPSGILVRGNLDDFPFDNGSGTLKGLFEVVDVDLKYGSKWPIANAVAATVALDNRRVSTSIHEGRIYQADVGGATIEIPDLFTRKRVARVRGSTRVTHEELGVFITESPLKNTKAARYNDVDIDGDFGLTLDMNLGLSPGSEKDVLGLLRFSGNRIHSTKQRLTLEEVAGDISFTRYDWYGEGLDAVFEGDRVGVVLNGGLDDPNYDTEFRMIGTSDAKQLFKYIERYAPILNAWLTEGSLGASIAGRLPWKAVLTIPEASEDGTAAPKRLTVESSLLGLNVDLPWPFGKSRAEQKPLTIRTETSHNGDRLTRIDFGSTVDIEIDQIRSDDGTLETRRTEILFGDVSPVFNRKQGLMARGQIDRLPINEWAAFASAAAGSAGDDRADFPISFDVDVENLEMLGRTFRRVNLKGGKTESSWQVSISGQQVLGDVTIPKAAPEQAIVLNFERLMLEKAEAGKDLQPIDPRALPAINLTCDSLRFGGIDLGTAELITTRMENGLKLEKLKFSQSNFNLQGSGDWLLEADVHRSRIDLRVTGKTLSGLLKSFDYEVANIDGGATDIKIEAAWGGMPVDFTLDKLHGSFSLHVEEGRFLDINPGSGRLFGLLSLQTLPRRLSLDFNDLFKKGFTFDKIEGVFELDRGNAYTNSLLMNGPSARIDISGRTGLADQDYDQRVTVTPALSNTIPVASALFGPAGIGVGAVIYLGQKMFKSIPEQVDKFLSREYSITGPWEQPVIERI